MRQFALLVLNDVLIYDQIATAKCQPRRDRLQAARAAVIAAYLDYAASAPLVAHLLATTPALSDLQKEALIHAYDVETKPSSKLREQLTIPVVRARCPFCGIGEASTLDHYLPKEQYPQFAIFSRNLVPCCSPCNTRKSHLVLDKATNIRLFLHPYFDYIPNEQFLFLQVTTMPTTINLKFVLQRPPGMAVRLFQHLDSHFKLLKLADRYRKMSLEHLRDERKAFGRFYGQHNDAAKVSAELTEKANDWEADIGSNHWRVILYRALAASNSFCDGGFKVLNIIQ